MEQNIQQFFTRVNDLRSETSFLQEIKKRRQVYDGLFTDEIIAYLLIDELGRNADAYVKIKDLHPGIECSIKAMITSIGEVKTFQRKKGSTGRLIKLIVTDETGSTPLILWNDDVSLVENNTLALQTMVTIINAYTKKGYNGIEINIGKWSSIEYEQKKSKNIDPCLQQSPEKHNIKGVLTNMQPTNVFFKDDGTEGFITKIRIQTDDGIKQLILWDKQVKRIQQYTIGDYICINQVDYRYVNGEKEIHVNGKATITSS